MTVGTTGIIVLKAKLSAPPLPAGHVARVRLRERFEPARPLTLVTAPAGFGKTLAVTQWLASVSAPQGWLSLDEGDNDAARFFAHLVAALDDACPGCCQGFTKTAAEASDSDVPALIAGVANALHAIETPFWLVLDDYHVIGTDTVHQTVGFLVEHMPPAMRLVITSRREPPLPLSRWRMRGRMTELRESDLRFASDEVAAFLAGTMGLSLDAEQTRLLERKTEGWIGGLQLAALSLVERSDRDDFLAAFAGDDRYVMDYLTAEVLAGQPSEVRAFLLRTSILERMNVSLCEAVSGQTGCGEILARLERDRVFVVALDGKREWYRYHHLFAGLLRHQLASSEHESASACHLAASAWFEEAGHLPQAARHARLAGKPERLGEIIETHGMDLAGLGRSKQVLGWVRQLSEEVLASNPRRLDAAMWCEYIRAGRIPASLRARADAMIAEASHPDASILIESRAVFEIYEAARDPARYAEAMERARQIPLDEGHRHVLIRWSAATIATCCAHALGDIETADAGYARDLAMVTKARAITGFFFSSLGRGRLRALAAGPAAGRRVLEDALAAAAEHGWDGLPVSAAVRYGLARQLYEMGEDAACEATYEQAISLAEHEPSTTRHPSCLGLARLYYAQGKREAGDAVLARIEGEAFIAPLVPILPDVGVERAWLDLARGRLDAVQAFLEAHGLGEDGGLTGVHGVRDGADLLVGRYLVLRHQYARAIALLTDTLQAAVATGRLDTVVRCRIDLAAARAGAGERGLAISQLDAAVDAAIERGYHRAFVDAPAAVQALIAQRLHSGVEREEGVEGVDADARRAFLEALVADPDADAQPVAEPLSPSERKVLEQLVAGLSNKEIAQALFVSPNTVKTHIRRIYAKLDARNRADAIRRAQAAGLGPA